MGVIEDLKDISLHHNTIENKIKQLYKIRTKIINNRDLFDEQLGLINQIIEKEAMNIDNIKILLKPQYKKKYIRIKFAKICGINNCTFICYNKHDLVIHKHKAHSF